MDSCTADIKLGTCLVDSGKIECDMSCLNPVVIGPGIDKNRPRIKAFLLRWLGLMIHMWLQSVDDIMSILPKSQ
jgi:hypothetical protein